MPERDMRKDGEMHGKLVSSLLNNLPINVVICHLSKRKKRIFFIPPKKTFHVSRYDVFYNSLKISKLSFYFLCKFSMGK